MNSRILDEVRAVRPSTGNCFRWPRAEVDTTDADILRLLTPPNLPGGLRREIGGDIYVFAKEDLENFKLRVASATIIALKKQEALEKLYPSERKQGFWRRHYNGAWKALRRKAMQGEGCE
jgi:hypothetical protein